MQLSTFFHLFNKKAVLKYRYTYRGKKKHLNPQTAIPASLIVIGLAIFILTRFLLPAQVISNYVIPFSRIFSVPLKVFTGIFPFSFLEAFVVCAIPLLIFFVVFVYRCKNNEAFLKMVTSVLFSIIGLLILTFSLTLGAGYYTLPLESSLGLIDEKITLSGLKNTTYYVAEKASTYRSSALSNGSPSAKLRAYVPSIKEAYGELSERFTVFKGMTSRPKAAILSVPLSYLGIGGMFSPFTCEAIINMDTTTPAIPFSAAHEMAHSLNIAKENEANFSAFYACINSADDYTAYSGYFNALLYLMNALHKADVNEYKDFLVQLDPQLKEDINAYFDHNRKYEGKVNEVHNKINDAYLKSNGQSAGAGSYGMVVELLIKWYEKEIALA